MTKQAEFLGQDMTDVYEVSFPEPNKRAKTDAEQRTEDLAAALSDSEASFVTIHKEENGRSKHCERIAADKYDLGQLFDYLQQEYGGGDYRIRVYAEGKITANKLVSIAIKKSAEKVDTGNSEMSQAINAIGLMIQRQNEQIMAMLSGNQSRKEFFEEMLLMKNLFGGGNNSNGISQLKESIELLQDLGFNNSEDSGGGFERLLEKLTPVLETGIKTSAQMKDNPSPRNGADVFNIIMKQKLKTLLNAAIRQSNPASYAEVVIDEFGAEKVQQFFADENAYNKMVQVEPRLKDHKEWLDLLAEHIKAQLGLDSIVSAEYTVDTSTDD